MKHLPNCGGLVYNLSSAYQFMEALGSYSPAAAPQFVMEEAFKGNRGGGLLEALREAVPGTMTTYHSNTEMEREVPEMNLQVRRGSNRGLEMAG